MRTADSEELHQVRNESTEVVNTKQLTITSKKTDGGYRLTYAQLSKTVEATNLIGTTRTEYVQLFYGTQTTGSYIVLTESNCHT